MLLLLDDAAALLFVLVRDGEEELQWNAQGENLRTVRYCKGKKDDGPLNLAAAAAHRCTNSAVVAPQRICSAARCHTLMCSHTDLSQNKLGKTIC